MTAAFYPTYGKGKLHPEAEAVLAEIAASGSKPLSALSPEEARASFLDPSWLGETPSGIAIHNLHGPVPLRAYTPVGPVPRPVLLFFHGGGFVLGTLDEFDPFCMALAQGAECLVVSVDYRLAPEHRFPAAPEDAMAALQWVATHAEALGGDPARIAVIGDSAGANLAAGVSRLARDAGFPRIIFQVLLCPWVDLTDEAETSDSFHHFGEGLWLSRANIRWFRGHYTDKPEQPLASPLKAERFEGLPPALVLAAEFDVLADQGRDYARKLEEAGVPVLFRENPGMLHDFVVLPGRFGAAREAINLITDALRTAFRMPR
jgi:acetyl esterase